MNETLKAKFATIQPTVVGIVGSEAGWVFTVIASKGVCEETSMRYANWPLYHFSGLSEEICKRVLHAIEIKPFKFSSLYETPLESFAKIIEQCVESDENEKPEITGGGEPATPVWVASLQSSLSHSHGDLYAFGPSFWNPSENHVEFFSTDDKLISYFLRQLDFVSWDDLDASEIDNYCEEAGMPGMVFWVPRPDGGGFDLQGAATVFDNDCTDSDNGE